MAQAQEALNRITATLQQTKETMQNGFRQMQSQSQQSSQQIKSDVDKMSTGIVSSIKDMHGQVTGAFSSLTATIGKIGTVFLGLGAIFAGGAIFKGAVDTFVNMNMQAKQMAVTMGMTIPNASALLESFKRVGIEGESATGMMVRMTRQLKTNEAQFNANGIVTRDAGGHLLSMNEIMFNSIDRLKEMQAGTERNLLATTIFGRSVQGMPGLLRMSAAAVAEMKDHLAKLGLTLDDVSVAKAIKFKEGMHDVGLVFDAVKYKIGEALIPTLMRLSAMFSKFGPDAVGAIAKVLNAFADFVGQATVAASNIRDAFAFAWDQMKIGAQTASNVMKATIQGNFSDAAAAAAAGYAAMKKSSEDWAAQAVRDANEVRFAISSAMAAKPGMPKGMAFMGGEVEHPEKAPETGGAAFVSKEKGGGGKDTQVADWEKQLEELKAHDRAFMDEEGAMVKAFWAEHLATGETATKAEEDSLQAKVKAGATARLEAEKGFWTERLSEAGAGTDAYAQVEKKIFELEQKINKDRLASETDLIKSKIAANQEFIKAQEASITQQMKLDQVALKSQEEGLKRQQKMKEITDVEELTRYRALLAQEQAEEEKKAEQAVALYAKDAVKYKEYCDKLVLLKRENALKLQQLDDQIAEKSQTDWSKLTNSMGSSFKSVVDSLMGGGKNMQSVLQGVFKNILNAFMEMIEQMISQLAIFKSMMAGLGGLFGGGGGGGAAEIGEAAISAVTSFLGFEHGGIVPSAAGGWDLPSAAGGWDLPSAAGGWNVAGATLALLHPREMVLPADLAGGVRDMVDQGGGGGGDTHVHFHVNTIDQRGVAGFLKDNHRHIINSINTGRRQGGRTTG